MYLKISMKIIFILERIAMFQSFVSLLSFSLFITRPELNLLNIIATKSFSLDLFIVTP